MSTNDLINAAQAVLDGSLKKIIIRSNGDLFLFNTAQELAWLGFSKEQELLKGLIVKTEKGKVVKVVAACFPKFYNLHESESNDQEVYRLIGQDSIVVNFTEKKDGTNIRPYWDDQSGKVKFATRTMLDGGKDNDEDSPYIHFGRESEAIAREKYPAILNPEVVQRYTFIFELIHPDNKIITDYGDCRDLILLSAFDLQNNCRELTRQELEGLAVQYGLNIVQIYRVDSLNFDEAINELYKKWEATDMEGAVASFELNGEVVFRLKIKSADYLKILSAIKKISFRDMVIMAEEDRIDSWEVFKIKLNNALPQLPEEVEMMAKDYFLQYQKIVQLAERKMKILFLQYLLFLKEHGKLDKTIFAKKVASLYGNNSLMFHQLVAVYLGNIDSLLQKYKEELLGFSLKFINYKKGE